jgi:hypothetical protein
VCLLGPTSASAAPVNDDFANAKALPAAVPQSFSTSNVDATVEPGEPHHAGKPGGHSIWFSWTPASTGPVAISTCAFSGVDTLLAVYTGDSVDSLTPVAANDDRLEGPPCTRSEVQFTATAGIAYRIAIDGKRGTEGSFQLSLRPPPANDDFADAQPLGPEAHQEVSGSNKLAASEPGEPDHAGVAGGGSVWYSWTPDSSGMVDVSATSFCLGPFDTLLAVYTGDSVDGLTPVAANDDGASPRCEGTDSELRFAAVAGTTYRIAVDGAGGSEGSFSLLIAATPGNDAFDAPEVLQPGFSQSLAATNALATKQPGEPDHAGRPGGHSVWFSWTPSESGPVSISSCPDERRIDPLLGVYVGAALGSLTPVAANDDAPGCGEASGSEVRFTATAGTTYRIAVDGDGGGEGEFFLDLKGRRSNDDFADPVTIATTPGFDFVENALAGREPGEPNHAGQPGGHSVWYLWTAPVSAQVVISTCDSFEGFDTLLGVYTGSGLGALTSVASNDDGPDCEEGGSEVRFEAVAGTAYRIAVDGKGGETGRAGLDLRVAAENDDFADAAPISTPIFSDTVAFGSNLLAGAEPGEPAHAGIGAGHSVWYLWTPDSSGPASISTCSSGKVDTLLAVYTGSSLASLAPVASGDDGGGGGDGEECAATDSEARFEATAGTAYRIAVDGKGGSEGDFRLLLDRRSGNDEFADAQEIDPDLPGFSSGSTTFATKEPGEPNHAGQPGGHSVWYLWTPSASGPVDVTTCTGGGVDTLLAVYTGSTLGNLTPVAGNDDATGCGAGGSELQFPAVAGTTYRIAVDAKGPDRGSFQLLLSGAPANDDFAHARTISSRLPESAFGTNRLATTEAGEPAESNRSVWFKWTAPGSGEFSLDTCGSDVDTLLVVYTGSAVDDLVPVQSNDDACGPQSKMTFEATAGQVYRIAVSGHGGAEGSIELTVRGAPRNDGFAKARPLPSPLPQTVFGSNRLATREAGEPEHAGKPGDRSVWYVWTPSVGGPVTLDTCGSDFDTLLAVYTGSAVNGLVPVASDDNGAACGAGASEVSFTAAAGTAYRVAVDGLAGDDGEFDLRVGRRKPPEPPLGKGFEPPPVGRPAAPPIAQPIPSPKPPALRCKKGFRKVRAHGRERCIRKRHRKPPHRR